jgi:hypothetical protein
MWGSLPPFPAQGQAQCRLLGGIAAVLGPCFEERLIFIRAIPRNPRTGFSGIVISVS